MSNSWGLRFRVAPTVSWILLPGTTPGSHDEEPRKIAMYLWQRWGEIIILKYALYVLHNKGLTSTEEDFSWALLT